MIANPTPRYYRIYRLLRQAIENGDCDPEKALPGEHVLAAQYEVSRLTIRRSLELLQHEGLIVRIQGRGTYPVASSIKSPTMPADISRLEANIATSGASTRMQVLEFGYESPTPGVRIHLELPNYAAVQKVIRVRYYDDEPFSCLTTYVPEQFGRRYTEADVQNRPSQTVFQNLGIRPASAKQSLSAMLADTLHAEALNVEVGSPLLCIRRLVRDTKGIPLEYLRAAYNPLRFEYRVSLKNDSGVPELIS